MILDNMYAFTENPVDIENIAKSNVYAVMKELNEKGDYESLSINAKNSIELLFDELMYFETYVSSKYKILGWIFDFSPYTKRYLVNDIDYGWKEIRAFNKRLIYELALNPEDIIEVVEIK